MADVAVTDTHPLVWYADEDWRRLGTTARDLFERAEAGSAAIYVPTLALVEVSELTRLGRIRPQGRFSRWAENLLRNGTFLVAALTADVVFRAETLYSISERTDRLIAATAVAMDCPLITRDREISSMSGVEVIW